MRIGINASDRLAHPRLGQLVEGAVSAEGERFASYWLAQTSLVDAIGALTLAGARTRSIELGTAVVPTWTRHPHTIAAQALTAQAASDGRFILGIGLSHQPVVEERFHMVWEKPIRHMNEYLDVLLPLLSDGAADVTGEIWSFTGEGGRPTNAAPSVMLAALGPQMLRLCGRRTDGTILWCVGPATIAQQIRPEITAGADAAGRPAPRIVCSQPVWVTDDVASARATIGRALERYNTLPSYRAMLDIEGVNGIEDIALVGSAEQVSAGLQAIDDAGATDFTAIVMGANPDEAAAATSVLHAFQFAGSA